MVEGRLRKYFEEVCLTMQAHMVEEGNPKVRAPFVHCRDRFVEPIDPWTPYNSYTNSTKPNHTTQVSELLEKTAKELGCTVELAGFIKYRTGEE